MLNKRKLLFTLLIMSLGIVCMGIFYYQRHRVIPLANSSIKNSSTSSQYIESKKESLYEDKVSKFNELTAVDAIKRINGNEQFFLYLGRKNCPDCQEFVPKLYNLAMAKKLSVYYVDTINSKDDELIKLRGKLGVETVPSFYFVSQQIFKLDSEREELSNFVEDHVN